MKIEKEDLDFLYQLAYGYAQGMGLDDEAAKKKAAEAVKRAYESK